MIEEAYADFRKVFGRGPENPFFEEYMTDDAEIVLVGMGTISLPMKVAHPQHARSRARRSASCGCGGSGRSRPSELVEGAARRLQGGRRHRPRLLASARRSTRGVVANEIRAAMYNADKRPPLLGFICGLGGREVTPARTSTRRPTCATPAAKAGKSDAKTPLDRRPGVGDQRSWPMRPRSRNATQILEPFKGVKQVTVEEYFISGHRTCQGCESALVMS